MAENRALYETATGKVVNIVVYDPSVPWVPPAGFTLYPNANVGAIGQVWNGSAFVDPPAPGPAAYDLSKRQICAALIISSTTTDPDGFMVGIIGHIVDATAKALALNDWQNAPVYLRDNPLFNDPDLLVAAGMTSDQVDALWMLAKDLPR